MVRAEDRVGNRRSTQFTIERLPARRLTVSRGESESATDFGNFELGTVSGMVFHDLDGNGRPDTGDAALGGRTIHLDANDDGRRQPTEPLAITDIAGKYEFTNVGPGTYRVRQLVPDGTIITMGEAGYDVPVTSGAVTTNLDFGNVQLASVSGIIFIDTDGDGSPDTNEERVPGGIVWIDANQNHGIDDGEQFASSDNNGNYTLSGIRPGNYSLPHAVPRLGHIVSTPTGGAYSLSLASGSSQTKRDFGSFQLGSINGRVFRDNNHSGTRNTGEPYLAGWTVYIDLNNNGSHDSAIEPSRVPNSSGSYEFLNLIGPGHNFVRTVPQSGWTHSTPQNELIDIVLSSGMTAANQNFGRFLGLTTSQTVVARSSGSAAQQPSDALPGVIHLLGGTRKHRRGHRR